MERAREMRYLGLRGPRSQLELRTVSFFMRLAICVATGYEQNSSLPKLPGTELDLEIVSQRLAQPDAGFIVHAFPAQRRLAEGIEQLIESLGQPLESLLFYFSGYALLDAERGPALLLDGERIGTLSLKRLRKIVQQYASEALVVLELISPPESRQTSEDLVSEVSSALIGFGSGASVLAAARPAHEASGASPFSNLLRMVLDWHDPSYTLSASALWAGMQAETALFDEIAAAAFTLGPSDPVLIHARAAETLGRPSGAGDAAGAADAAVFPFEAPTLQSFEAAGDALVERGEQLAALDQYEGARAQLAEEPGADHVRLYEKIATVLRKVERLEDARAYCEAALAIDPDAPAALDGVTDLSLELGDVERARAWLERWTAVDPKALIALERLLGLQLAAGEHEAALETRRRIAHASTDPNRAAEQLYAAALSAEEALRDQKRALDLYEEALSFNPNATEVLERAERLLEQRREYERLAAIYEFSLERATSHELAQALARRLGDLCRQRLSDSGRAARALARSSELDPGNHSLFAELSRLFSAQGDYARAAEQARRALAAEPKAEYLRLALRAFEKTGEADAAWNAANALEWLGEADINESLVASQHKPEGLLMARSNLADGDWSEAHLSGDIDPTLVELIWALRDAIVEIGVAAAKKQRDLPELDPAQAQDPAKSTTTLAKTLLWTSRLLAVQTPELYVVPEVRGELLGHPEKNPISVASRSVGSGLSLPELAFLWGRHLVQFRREHELSLFVPDADDQVAFLSAALAVGGSPEHEPRSLDGNAKRFAAGLKKHLRGPKVEHVKDIVRRQAKVDPVVRMRAYRKRAERAALRAGLLACGDIEIAARLSERFPSGREFRVEERRAELVSFSVSASYAHLRRRLGVAVSG
ncbi:MAG TPA: tetratricopeptide repeat protein [Polyangiaceae bacterium]|nr:tetratricopeptide repeat protein [Polyangiaceae bacterium]